MNEDLRVWKSTKSVVDRQWFCMVAKRRIRIVDDELETGSKETSAKIFLDSYKRVW